MENCELCQLEHVVLDTHLTDGSITKAAQLNIN